jgi:DNA-binding MarR family transcriptional regulator
VIRVPTDEALLALARLAMDVSVRAASELGGISPVQLRALTALRQRGAVNLAQLAEEMGVAVSTASRLVDRLVAVDWVHRAPSSRNRREIRLSVTEDGKQLLRRFDERRVALLRSCLDRVPTERQQAVVAALVDLTRPPGAEQGIG